jgi:hypothetical protein
VIRGCGATPSPAPGEAAFPLKINRSVLLLFLVALFLFISGYFRYGVKGNYKVKITWRISPQSRIDRKTTRSSRMRILCAINPPLCAAAHKGGYVISAIMLHGYKLPAESGEILLETTT